MGIICPLRPVTEENGEHYWAADAPLAGDDEKRRRVGSDRCRPSVRHCENAQSQTAPRTQHPLHSSSTSQITWSCVTRHNASCWERVEWASLLTSSPPCELPSSDPLSPPWKRARLIPVAHTWIPIFQQFVFISR